jgi:hypothetical protein
MCYKCKLKPTYQCWKNLNKVGNNIMIVDELLIGCNMGELRRSTGSAKNDRS